MGALHRFRLPHHPIELTPPKRGGVSYSRYVGYIEVYVTSQPKDTMLLTVTSSLPTEAKPSLTLVAITPDDWVNPQTIEIESIDDAYADGDIHFNVTVATLFTSDPDYGQIGPNREGSYGLISTTVPFISLDDPDDTAQTSCQPGYWGLYADVGIESPYYNDWYGCEKCPPGTWADESADKLWCRACPPGSFGLTEGAVAMQSATDWEGSALDPGCVPCPNGTYNEDFGATACKLCPENRTCALATSWPLPKWMEAEVIHYTGVQHHWKLLNTSAFPILWLPIYIGGRNADGEARILEIQATEANFQYLMILCAAGATAAFFIGLYFVRRYSKDNLWKRMKPKILLLDNFKEMHYKREDESDVQGMSGVFASMTFIMSSMVLIGFVAYNFVEFNFLYSEVRGHRFAGTSTRPMVDRVPNTMPPPPPQSSSQTLVPKDESKVRSILANFEVSRATSPNQCNDAVRC